MSDPQRPHASTFTTTSPGPAFGSGRFLTTMRSMPSNTAALTTLDAPRTRPRGGRMMVHHITFFSLSQAEYKNAQIVSAGPRDEQRVRVDVGQEELRALGAVPQDRAHDAPIREVEQDGL